MFRRIDHVAFGVKDREKSIEFYQRHFGFEMYYEHDVPVPHIEKIVYLRLGDTVLEMVHISEGPLNRGYHFCLQTDDFAADYERLKGAGIEVEQEAHPVQARVAAETGWRRAVFKGPDGESIEIRG